MVGTINGFVQVIEPGSSPLMANSTFSYQAPCLGQFIEGLDVGNLDGDDDADDEIACGNWIDNGTLVDWRPPVGPNLKKNRGHLILLDPNPSAGAFNTPVELDGDDLFGLGNGIGSGVTGVKIDDVDGDGTNEIWCSDGVGHVYLFVHDDPTPPNWRCRYRSDDLGVYPGFYNNLFPIKGGVDGRQTVKLAVVSPGYVMLFSVDPTVVH